MSITDEEMRRLREEAEFDVNAEFGSEIVLALLDRVAAAEAQWRGADDMVGYWRAKAEEAEAENAALRATVERVRELADEWEREAVGSHYGARQELWAALDEDRLPST